MSDLPKEGWQTVRYSGLQYKVPPDWEIETVRTDNLEVPKPTYAKGFCKASPNESLGMVLLTRNTDATSPKKAVRAELQHAADAFYSDRSPRLDLGQQKHKGDVAAGAAGIELAPSDNPCDGSSAIVVVRGWTAPDNAGVDLLVAIGELGLKKSPDAGDIARIANSVEDPD